MNDEIDTPTPAPLTFRDLNLPATILKALDDVGYESPSPIQAATIPSLLAGRDVLGQAQTGTGKTAAFALPVLARIDPNKRLPQALVLTPTRELAIQVAEAFQKYATHLPGFQILPIYGGQGYGPQLHALRRGVQVVVGTPGRVIDHLNRGTLDISALDCLVLDEADEMLRMGFVDDVEAVLQKTPPTRQIALFSATMPAPIRRIAQTHLKDPVEVTIKAKTTTATNIRQRFWPVSGIHKLDALTRILEAEPFDAMIIFARTKAATEELAEKLAARGMAAAAINGDIQQQQRERTIQRLKEGQIDILVATDVAARGLDVERISHVLNFDIPYDTEAYVHRIGRTGRAGRSGDAILFVAPRERGMLRAIERATRQPIEEMRLPTVEAVNDQRIAKFKQRISDAVSGKVGAVSGVATDGGELDLFRQLVEQYERDHNVPAIEIAAALARLVQGETPLLLEPERKPVRTEQEKWAKRRDDGGRDDRSPARGRPDGRVNEHYGQNERRPRRDESNAANKRPAPASTHRSDHVAAASHAAPDPAPAVAAPTTVATPPAAMPAASAAAPAHAIERFDDGASTTAPARTAAPPSTPAERPSRPERPAHDTRPRRGEEGKETFRIEVGHEHGVKPANIVGAIANEAGLDSAHIGRIDIRDNHTFIDLPAGMPGDVFKHLKRVWVSGQQLRISRADEEPEARDRYPRKPRSPFAGGGAGERGTRPGPDKGGSSDRGRPPRRR